MQQIELFKQSIFKVKLNEDLNKITNFCLKIYKTEEGRKKSNFGGYQSNDLNKDEIFLNSLINHIEINSNKIMKNHFKINDKIFLKNIWFNINKYKDFNVQHTHPFSKISGVFYVKTPENSGNIVFINKTKIDNYLDNFIFEYNQHNSSTWSIKPEENELYFFPSWLNHFVEPNLSKKERISFSFNLC